MSSAIQTRLDGRMSEWFVLPEFTKNRHGITNHPTSAYLTNLTILAQNFLDPVREAVGKPVVITSGYRCPALNVKVGGSKTSAHLSGEAADFKVEGMTAPELVQVILGLGLPFDQVIAYAPERGGHVHLGIRAGADARARRQVLWAPKSGGYEPFNRASA